jgi:hypothetical protein
MVSDKDTLKKIAEVYRLKQSFADEERKPVYEMLRQSEEQYRTLFEHSMNRVSYL